MKLLVQVLNQYHISKHKQNTFKFWGRFARFLFGQLPFYPVYLTIRLLRPYKLVRFIPMSEDRIGGFASSLGYYTCEKTHGIAHQNTYDIFYYYQPVCNQQLMKMWKRVLRVSFFANFFARILWTKPYGKMHRIKLNPVDTYGLRYSSAPCIGLTPAEETQAQTEMQLIVPDPERPFICILSRDKGYLQSMDPSRDWTYHDYRNCTISHYAKAADALAEKGYTIFRLGSHTTEPLSSKNPNVLDYANENCRTDLLDIYLTIKCRFLISSGTGMDTLANIFQKPVLYVNLLPYICFPFFSNVICMPKLLFSNKLNRLLTFNEIYNSPICKFGTSQEYRNEDIEIMENTDDEILDASLEMEQRLGSTWVDTEIDTELQNNFWGMFPKGNVFHGGHIKSKISSSFLKKHRLLLET